MLILNSNEIKVRDRGVSKCCIVMNVFGYFKDKLENGLIMIIWLINV